MAAFGPNNLPEIFQILSAKEFFRFTTDHNRVVEALIEIGFLKQKLCENHACRVNHARARCYPGEHQGRPDGWVWRCRRCRRHYPIRAGSFAEECHLELEDLLFLVYCWAHKLPVGRVVGLAGLPKQTVLRWYRRIRVKASQELIHTPDLFRFGGVGYPVQIDESVISKRKFNRGRLRRQQWVFGIYDVNRKYGYVRLVRDRKRRRLWPIIRRYVAPGTTIASDEWRAYIGIQHMWGVNPPYVHMTVNHSRWFVDPVTGTNTQAVESYWSRVKKMTRYAGTRRVIPELLDEVMWRERLGKTDRAAWINGLICLSSF